MEAELLARLIAFYLPQFHPIPENDEWWGKGFTEWRNVVSARPLFHGHNQPNLPADLGFYDLRVPEVREQQADLAKKHGIEGFCYWHYWFNGKLLLERPFMEVITSGKPDFPFCLAWANEPWSRRWTGEPLDILQDQVYGGNDDDIRHFEWLLPAFKDPRAIKIDGKPVFLIYKADQIPNIQRMLALWRELARKHGLAGLYLMSIETTGTFGVDTRQWGFDAVVEFQPHWNKCGGFLECLNWSVFELFGKIFNRILVFFNRILNLFNRILGFFNKILECFDTAFNQFFDKLLGPRNILAGLFNILFGLLYKLFGFLYKSIKLLSHLLGLSERLFHKLLRLFYLLISGLLRLFNRIKYGMWVLDYRKLWPHLVMTQERDYPFYPGVFPRWDNTPRKGKTGLVIQHSTPREYGRWLHETIKRLQSRPEEHRIVFINAWNEWAEGNYLEPDLESGHAYLEATYRANLKKSL